MQQAIQSSSRSIQQRLTMESQTRLKVQPTVYALHPPELQRISSAICKVLSRHLQMGIRATNIVLNRGNGPNTPVVAGQALAKRSKRMRRVVR